MLRQKLFQHKATEADGTISEGDHIDKFVWGDDDFTIEDAEEKSMNKQKADDCMEAAMSEIKTAHPDMEHDQMVAIAMDKCGQSDKSLDRAVKAGRMLNQQNASTIMDMWNKLADLLTRAGLIQAANGEDPAAADDSEPPDEAAAENPVDEAAEPPPEEVPPEKKPFTRKSLPERARDFLFGSKDRVLSGRGFQAVGDNQWVAWWSNNFEDREKEVFTEKAHDAYVWRLDHQLTPMPELWYHHIKGSRHGAADWIDRIGHMMVAVGHFDDTELGRAFKAAYQRSKDPLAVSHGYVFPQRALQGGAYSDYNTFELSPLAPSSAANSYTLFEELKTMSITPEKRVALEKMIGKEKTELVFSASEIASKEIEALGVKYKDFANPNAPAATSSDDPVIADIVVGVQDGQAILLQALHGLETKNTALETASKALADDIADVRKQMDLRPRRASTDERTRIDPDMYPQGSKAHQLATELLKEANADAAAYNPFWGTEVKPSTNGGA